MTTELPTRPAGTSTQRGRVFLVDDHPLVREWLVNLINQQADLTVCGEAEDAPRALAAILELRPQVVIIDLTLSSGSGLELLKDLRVHSPDTAAIVLSMHDESLYGERALRAGARGYVMKRETTKKILSAIRKVMQGEVYVSEAFANVIAQKMVRSRPRKTDDPSALATLSDRELEVFRLLGQGWGTPRIAETLGLSLKTVQAYCARIKEKRGLANATELLRAAMQYEQGESRVG
jgi:DNA-binding NarL/FixJ family response regulator